MVKMISTKITRDERDIMVQRIIATIQSATKAQYRHGMHWYPEAHHFAEMLANGGSIRQMAGMIAALSANTSWKRNITLANDAANGKQIHHFGDVIRKVEAIMNGTDPIDVLPMTAKTGNFFRCINDPSDPDAVVIDRHAYDVATGERNGNNNRGLSNPKRYALLAHIYREAALQLGILPQQAQAIAWVVWTER
jgi:hypothetical protein